MKFVRIGDTIVNAAQIFNVAVSRNYIDITSIEDKNCSIRFESYADAKEALEKLLLDLNKEDN